MNMPHSWARAMFTGNMRRVADLRSCMTPEQLNAGGRLLSDLRIKAGSAIKARRKS